MQIQLEPYVGEITQFTKLSIYDHLKGVIKKYEVSPELFQKRIDTFRLAKLS